MFKIRSQQRLDMDGYPCRVLPDTQLLVDAFPRCGNTFLYHLLRETQKPEIRIAHHMHSAGHLALGEQLGVPTVTILRKPQAACISYIIRNSKVTAKQSLLDYLYFHTTLARLSGVLIIPFERLVKETDDVLRQISQQYSVVQHATVDAEVLENVAQRVSVADKRDRVRRNDSRNAQFTAGKPNASRASLKAQRGEEIDAYPKLLSRCNDIYEQILRRC